MADSRASCAVVTSSACASRDRFIKFLLIAKNLTRRARATINQLGMALLPKVCFLYGRLFGRGDGRGSVVLS